VAVVTPAGVSSIGPAELYTYQATAPIVTGVSPNTGSNSGGTVVTINGADFNGATAVSFGGVAATGVTVVSPSQITATSPAGSVGTVDVTVTSPYGTSAVTPADQFTYLPSPTVTSISPTSGPMAGGTAVTVNGTNLTGLVSVTFGGLAASAITVNSSTQLTATAPAATVPGPVDVVVTTNGGSSPTSSADLYTFVAPTPTVTGVSPTSGSTNGGTAVTITGTGFTWASSVWFGNISASFTVNSSTQITATSPAHAAGLVDVLVTTLYGGTSAAVTADHFTYVSPPVIVSLNPGGGPNTGGTVVTITGSSFTGATSVWFGGTRATSFTVNSDSRITATSPAHAVGTVDVTVTTPYGTSPIVPADHFTFNSTNGPSWAVGGGSSPGSAPVRLPPHGQWGQTGGAAPGAVTPMSAASPSGGTPSVPLPGSRVAGPPNTTGQGASNPALAIGVADAPVALPHPMPTEVDPVFVNWSRHGRPNSVLLEPDYFSTLDAMTWSELLALLKHIASA
jgi:hypothetical protein